MSRRIALAALIVGLTAAAALSQDKPAESRPPEELRRIERHKDWAWSVARSPDEWRLLTCGGDPDHTARVRDFASGKELRRLDLPKGQYDAAWPTVPIWAVAMGKLLHTIEVTTGGTLDLTFTADGSRLVGGCGDGTAWVATLPDRFPGETPRPQPGTKAGRKGS